MSSWVESSVAERMVSISSDESACIPPVFGKTAIGVRDVAWRTGGGGERETLDERDELLVLSRQPDDEGVGLFLPVVHPASSSSRPRLDEQHLQRGRRRHASSSPDYASTPDGHGVDARGWHPGASSYSGELYGGSHGEYPGASIAHDGSGTVLQHDHASSCRPTSLLSTSHRRPSYNFTPSRKALARRSHRNLALRPRPPRHRQSSPPSARRSPL